MPQDEEVEDEFFDEEEEEEFDEEEEEEEEEFDEEELIRENEENGFVFAGNIPVDSGQIMLIDPCYVKSNFENEYGAKPFGLNYSGACEASLSKQGFGVFGNDLGFCTRTAYGDGSYPVFVKRDRDGTIKEVKIVFA